MERQTGTTSSSWEVAREYFEIVGEPHGLFTNCVRALRYLSLADAGAPVPYDNPHLVTLYKSPRFRVVLYAAAVALYPERISMGQEISGKELFALYSISDLIAVITTAYLYRNVKQLSDPKSWEYLSLEVQAQMEAGALVGSAVPGVELWRGLLVGAMRYIVMGLFSQKDQRGFRMFRRHLHDNDLLFDLRYEEKTWGCNHLQIASLLLQAMGFGIDISKGICSSPQEYLITPETPVTESLRWLAARVWIESMLEKERVPEAFKPISEFALSEENVASLQTKVEAIYDGGSNFTWLDAVPSDVTKQLLDRLAVVTALQEKLLVKKQAEEPLVEAPKVEEETKELNIDSSPSEETPDSNSGTSEGGTSEDSTEDDPVEVF